MAFAGVQGGLTGPVDRKIRRGEDAVLPGAGTVGFVSRSLMLGLRAKSGIAHIYLAIVVGAYHRHCSVLSLQSLMTTANARGFTGRVARRDYQPVQPGLDHHPRQ